MFGKNLESACKGWSNRERIRLLMASEEKAAVVATLAIGSDDWKTAMREFVKAETALQNFVESRPN